MTTYLERREGGKKHNDDGHIFLVHLQTLKLFSLFSRNTMCGTMK